jgi:hemerythrin superfamily protein
MRFPTHPREKTMDILKSLKQDHDEVKQILEEITESSDRAEKKRLTLFLKFKSEIVAHARAEEEVVYAPLLEALKKDDAATIREGYEEHFLVDKLLPEIEQLSPSDPQWLAKVTVVKEMLEHHIKEEQGEIFGMVRKEFESEQRAAMDEQFQSIKSEIKKTSKAA